MKFCASAGRKVKSTGNGSPVAISVYAKPANAGSVDVVVEGSSMIDPALVVEAVVVEAVVAGAVVEVSSDAGAALVVVDVEPGSASFEQATDTSRNMNRSLLTLGESTEPPLLSNSEWDWWRIPKPAIDSLFAPTGNGRGTR